MIRGGPLESHTYHLNLAGSLYLQVLVISEQFQVPIITALQQPAIQPNAKALTTYSYVDTIV